MSDNDILKEQRKAREEFLKLKKMQHGEMDASPKPSEVAIVPKTFKEKLQNYWFHYKWHTILIAFLTVATAFLCVQCANREESDFQVIFFSYESCIDAQMDEVEKYLEKYATDINGDGKVNVVVINCSFAEKGDAQYKNTMLSKVQTQLVSNEQAILFITDDKAYEYLNSIVEDGVFVGEKVVLTKEFYDTTATEDFGALPENLSISLRRLRGTILEKKEQANTVFKECEKVMDKIKEEIT